MTALQTDPALTTLTRIARPLDGGAAQLDPIVARIGEASTVLIGEASHGTQEFYAVRAALTRQLIADRGFAAVVIEGDWPDAVRVDRYVRGEGEDRSAAAALADFERFPTWMWRNREVERFVAWLRERNGQLPPSERAGFYGVDLYSLYRSIAAVLEFLDAVDPAAAARARDRYACFDAFEPVAQAYGRAAGLGLHPSCERVAIAQLVELRQRAAAELRGAGSRGAFFAEQNARVVREAERYYRAMFGGRTEAWNLRDRHMFATCEALRAHLRVHGAGDKLVVWAHNSHVGDARATAWRRVQQVNLGQLMRERHGGDPNAGGVVLIGATTHLGTVTAATDWERPAETMPLRPSLRGSWERTLHQVSVDRGLRRYFVITEEAGGVLDEPRLNRAVGVVYRPQTERASHYYASRLGPQYDVVLHYDETRAVEPLERWPGLRGSSTAEPEPAETYPFGL